MLSIADIMLQNALFKRGLYPVHPPPLRRQLAGDLENPFDLNDTSNQDILLFCTEYLRQYGLAPTEEQLLTVAMFPAKDNFQALQKSYLKL